MNLFLSAAMLLATATAAEPVPPEAAAAWEAMSQVGSLEARFTQVRHSSLLAAPLQSEGVLRFRRPDALAWVVTEPARSTMIMLGDNVGMAFPDLGVQQELDLSSDPDTARLVGSMMIWLTGDLEAVTQSYAITWEAAEGGGTAHLRPTDPAMAALIASMDLSIAGEPPRIEAVVLHEPDADRVEITLHDVKIDPDFPADAFSLTGSLP